MILDMTSNVEGNAVGFDAHHTLAIKGAPSALSFLAGNGKVTATDDGRIGGGLASTFDLGGVTGIELQLTDGAISLAELHRNDGATSVEDELADDLGLGLREQNSCHGKKRKWEALAPLLTIVPMERAPCKPLEPSVSLIVLSGGSSRRIVTVCSNAADQDSRTAGCSCQDSGCALCRSYFSAPTLCIVLSSQIVGR